jgi:DNA repair exonuclease SbcCD ATPase subunit
MKLRRILLENVCQFIHLDHTFHPGLTGIIGPNGSGKSNFAKAIYFALTGVFRNAGIKADNIAQRANGKRAAVTLWVEHHGIELEVVRALAGARTSLRISSEDQAILGDNAATARIVEILGVDVRTLGDYVFIPQMHMTDFIEAPPGERAKVFQRLFGAEDCEAVHDFAVKTLERELRPAELIDLPQVRSRLRANTDRMEQLLDELERLDAEVVLAEAREIAARQLIGDSEEQARCHDDLSAAMRELSLLRATLVTRDREYDAIERELSRQLTALERAGEDAKEAAIVLATWRTVEDRRRRADQLRRRRSQLEAEATANREPAPPRPLSKGTVARLADLRTRLVQLEALQRLVEGGEHVCPTCYRPIDVAIDFGDELAHVRGSVAYFEECEQEYRRLVAACENWRTWSLQHACNWRQLLDDEAVLEGEIVVNPDVDPAQLNKVVDAEKELKAAVDGLRRRANDALTELGKLRGRCDGMSDLIDDLERRVRGLEVSPAALETARQDLARLESLHTTRARVEGESDGLARALNTDEALLTQLEAAEARNAVIVILRTGLTQVAEVTHRNAAPRFVSEAYLDRLVDDVDEMLDLFGSDFRVRLGPSLSFLADFADGRVQAGGRLSEGQKGVLALAFWVAVNSLFARQIGFLSLDEPTAALDQHNLGALEVAFDRLRGLSEALGLQCLLVTHEPGVAGLFDDVFQLGNQ